VHLLDCIFFPAGVPASQKWLERRSQLAAEHIAAGQFSGAMSLLFRQLGVVAFEPLRPHFMELYNASHAALPGLQVGTNAA
jgi:coatomer protein complex subunit alpha (xenin)